MAFSFGGAMSRLVKAPQAAFLARRWATGAGRTPGSLGVAGGAQARLKGAPSSLGSVGSLMDPADLGAMNAKIQALTKELESMRLQKDRHEKALVTAQWRAHENAPPNP